MGNKVVIRGCMSERGKDAKDTCYIPSPYKGFTVYTYPEGLKLEMKSAERDESVIQIGNQIEIQLDENQYSREESFWMEKTDVPYANDWMRPNEWMNMINTSSRVFEDMCESEDDALQPTKTQIIDPPTATAGGTRTLEFVVYLRGEKTEENFLFIAKQQIGVEDSLDFAAFTVHKCGMVKKDKEEELLKMLRQEDDEDVQMKMNDVLQYVNEIENDGFTPIQVEYCTDKIYLFNGWAD